MPAMEALRVGTFSDLIAATCWSGGDAWSGGTYRTESSDMLAWRFAFFFAAGAPSGAARAVPTRAKRRIGLMNMLGYGGCMMVGRSR